MAAASPTSSSPSWLAGFKATLLQSHDRPPWLLRYRSNSAFICATVSIAVFTVRVSVLFSRFSYSVDALYFFVTSLHARVSTL